MHNTRRHERYWNPNVEKMKKLEAKIAKKPSIAIEDDPESSSLNMIELD